MGSLILAAFLGSLYSLEGLRFPKSRNRLWRGRRVRGKRSVFDEIAGSLTDSGFRKTAWIDVCVRESWCRGLWGGAFLDDGVLQS